MIRRSSHPMHKLYRPNHCANAFGFGSTIVCIGEGNGDQGNTLSSKPSKASNQLVAKLFISADMNASVAGWSNLEPPISSRGCSD